MNHVMVDLETWGLTPGSHIRSIGAVAFDPHRGELGSKFYCNVAEFPNYGLTSDPATRVWWNEQSFDAREAFKLKQRALPVALGRFVAWFQSLFQDSVDVRVWAHGPQFDVSILDAAFRAIGLPVPWHYRAPRDCRTILEAAGMDPALDFPPVGTAHNALDDAVSQALGVMEAFHRLRIIG